MLPLARDGGRSPLVDYEDRGLEVGAQLLGEAPGGVGFVQVSDHVVERGEVDRVAGLTRRDRQAHGEHGLADPRAGRADTRWLSDR